MLVSVSGSRRDRKGGGGAFCGGRYGGGGGSWAACFSLMMTIDVQVRVLSENDEPRQELKQVRRFPGFIRKLFIFFEQGGC